MPTERAGQGAGRGPGGPPHNFRRCPVPGKACGIVHSLRAWRTVARRRQEWRRGTHECVRHGLPSTACHPRLTIESRRYLENKEIARILAETADLMEIAGEDSFRIRSYRNGATAIEGHPERIADILRDTSRKVTDIP